MVLTTNATFVNLVTLGVLGIIFAVFRVVYNIKLADLIVPASIA